MTAREHAFRKPERTLEPAQRAANWRANAIVTLFERCDGFPQAGA
jgi:hypothetical protein